MMTILKTAFALAITVLCYWLLGMIPVLGHWASLTVLVVTPLCWLFGHLGAILGVAGLAALGCLTAKGLASMWLFGWLSQKLA